MAFDAASPLAAPAIEVFTVDGVQVVLERYPAAAPVDSTDGRGPSRNAARGNTRTDNTHDTDSNFDTDTNTDTDDADADAGSVVISVRGTASLTNAWQDLEMGLEFSHKLQCRLHGEFARLAATILPEIQSRVLGGGAGARGVVSHVRLFGHSLGGAVALILAMHLAAEAEAAGVAGMITEVVTVGQPMITDHAGAQLWEGRVTGLLRLHNGGDPAVISPPFPSYAHFGSSILMQRRPPQPQSGAMEGEGEREGGGGSGGENDKQEGHDAWGTGGSKGGSEGGEGEGEGGGPGGAGGSDGGDAIVDATIETTVGDTLADSSGRDGSGGGSTSTITIGTRNGGGGSGGLLKSSSTNIIGAVEGLFAGATHFFHELGDVVVDAVGHGSRHRLKSREGYAWTLYDLLLGGGARGSAREAGEGMYRTERGGRLVRALGGLLMGEGGGEGAVKVGGGKGRGLVG
jgi:hypothetical protein